MSRLSKILLLLAAAAALAFATQAASAATSGAHFFSASASVNSTTGQLLLSWDESGVGNQDISYVLTDFSQSAIYACYNKGGNHPQASNKEGPTPPSNIAVGTFSPTNGRVTENNVPVPGTPLASTLVCPSGQFERIVQVTYSFTSLLDTVNNVSVALAAPGCVSLDKNFPC